MSKQAYFFSHDSNASQDDKILDLRSVHGWSGYGIYWAIIERLRDTDGYKIPEKRINGLAIFLNVQPEILESILKDFDLFIFKNGFFYSKSLLKRMDKMEGIIEKRREAGRLSGAKRNTNKSATNDEHMLNTCSTTSEQLKEIERKLKESIQEEEEEEVISRIFHFFKFQITPIQVKEFCALNSGQNVDFSKISLINRIILFIQNPKRNGNAKQSTNRGGGAGQNNGRKPELTDIAREADRKLRAEYGLGI